jgi:hypothetical protein
MKWQFITTSITSVALAGCQQAASEAVARGPRALIVDSYVLERNDPLSLARPLNAVIDEGGMLYISDAFHNVIFAYDSTGALQRHYGNSPSAAGELIALGGVLGVSESSVVTFDYLHHELWIFDRSSGLVIARVPYEGRLATGRVVGGDLWLGSYDLSTGRAIARWPIAGLQPATPVQPDLVPVPSDYMHSQALSSIFDGVFLEPRFQHLVYTFGAVNELYIRADGGSADAVEIRIPAVRRKGVPYNVVSKFARRGTSFAEIFSAVSVTFGLERIDEHRAALVHFDQKIKDRLISARPFVSIVAFDTKQACVDGVVPVAPGIQPVVVLRADTVYVIEHTAAGNSAHTSVKKYRIADDECTWIGVERRSVRE